MLTGTQGLHACKFTYIQTHTLTRTHEHTQAIDKEEQIKLDKALAAMPGEACSRFHTPPTGNRPPRESPVAFLAEPSSKSKGVCACLCVCVRTRACACVIVLIAFEAI